MKEKDKMVGHKALVKEQMVPWGEIATWLEWLEKLHRAGKALRVSWKLKSHQDSERGLRGSTPSLGSEGPEGWGRGSHFSLSIGCGSLGWGGGDEGYEHPLHPNSTQRWRKKVEEVETNLAKCPWGHCAWWHKTMGPGWQRVPAVAGKRNWQTDTLLSYELCNKCVRLLGWKIPVSRDSHRAIRDTRTCPETGDVAPCKVPQVWGLELECPEAT